jgi:hypothetical protein
LPRCHGVSDPGHFNISPGKTLAHLMNPYRFDWLKNWMDAEKIIGTSEADAFSFLQRFLKRCWSSCDNGQWTSINSCFLSALQ